MPQPTPKTVSEAITFLQRVAQQTASSPEPDRKLSVRFQNSDGTKMEQRVVDIKFDGAEVVLVAEGVTSQHAANEGYWSKQAMADRKQLEKLKSQGKR